MKINLKKIDNYKIISFDIFDTALIRDVSTPTDVFKIVETISKNKGFFEKRCKIEKIVAEKKGLISPTLNDIYNNFYDEAVKKVEIEVEKSILHANKDIKKIYDYCLKKNKDVIFVSDMYLNETILSDFLISNGYTKFKKIFVSSEYNKTKRDGQLFDTVINELKCNGDDILHIGDSLKADYIEPKKHHIGSILYKKKKEKINKENLEKNIIQKFIYNTSLNEDVFYKYGYEKLGILLYGFTNWLIKEINNLNINNVFFLSRDGYILKNVFDELNNDINIKSNYLYVSRRSLNIPNLWKNSEFKNLKKNITMSNVFDVKTFIKRLGLEPSGYEEKLKMFDLNIDDELTKENFVNNKKLEEFYSEIKNDVINNSMQEYKLVVEYLKQNSFNGKIAIVDIGWHGTMQKQLIKICKNSGIKVDIYGFYVGQEKIVENGKGFLFNEDDNLINKIAIAGSFGLFESFFLGNHGSVKKYKSNNKKIVPVLQKYEFQKNDINLENLKRIQLGALEFCHTLNQNKIIKHLNLNSEVSFSFLRNLCISPSLSDVNNLKNIKFNDTYTQDIVCFNGIRKYLFNFKMMKNDFYKSVWKIGFIKKFFKLNLPYFKIYYKIKSKEKD